MAYYQSEDPGYPRASYSSRPLDSFEEPSSPARSRGPVLFLLFCVAAIAAVWTLATAGGSDPNISIRADSDDTTDAYMQALNLVRSMHEKAAAQGEQGLEDIEDLDEVESPPASSDDPSVDSDSSHFMTCLERSCSPSMYDVAAANPSGSQLLQCLSSAPDGVTATACWAPESDDAQGTPTHLTFETEKKI